MQPKESKPVKTCLKCKVKPSEVNIRENYPLCKECFLSFIQHKFRTSIGQSRSIKRGENVLIALSGGICSRGLLDIFFNYHKGAENPKSGKVQKFKNITIGFIDESSLLGTNSNLDTINNIVKLYNLPLISQSLEDIFSPIFTNSSEYNEIVKITNDTDKNDIYKKLESVKDDNHMTNKEKLLTLFNSISSDTVKEDLLKHIKITLLNFMAKKAGCSILCLGDSSTKVANNVISYTSKGRGFSLPLDIGLEAKLMKEIMMIRPIKTLLFKELEQYVVYNNLEVINEKVNTEAEINKSIDLIANRFISELQENFPSTVTTIVSSANKLSINTSIGSENNCALCLAPRRKNAESWYHNHTISKVEDTSVYTNDKLDEDTENQDKVIPPEYKHFCFNCQIILNSIDSEAKDVFLPPYVSESIYC